MKKPSFAKYVERHDQIRIADAEDKVIAELRDYAIAEYRKNPALFEMFLVNQDHQLNELFGLWGNKKAATGRGVGGTTPSSAWAQQRDDDQLPFGEEIPTKKKKPLPFGEEIDDGMGSKATSTALNALLPNVLKAVARHSPRNKQAAQQAVDAFKQQWLAFKKQVAQLVGAQGVKDPHKHGLTYGFAPEAGSAATPVARPAAAPAARPVR